MGEPMLGSLCGFGHLLKLGLGDTSAKKYFVGRLNFLRVIEVFSFGAKKGVHGPK